MNRKRNKFYIKKILSKKDLLKIYKLISKTKAKYLADKMKKEVGFKEVLIGYVGSVIGSHSGPGTLALFYLGTER